MPRIDYEKYLVREPLWEAGPGIRNRQSPTMTYMSSKQVPDSNYYIELGWIYDIPEPNPHIHEHVHDFDEIVLHWGGNPDTPQDLGGEIELYIGGQPITFNTTTGIFIPKGTPHGPLTWKKFRFPHVEMALMLECGDAKKGWGRSGIKEAKHSIPKKTINFDYEQYVIRSPLREAGAPAKNRQFPTMTYMDRKQINVANYYIEFGWIYGMPEPNPHIHRHIHRKYDEIVLHLGGDPRDPTDLGGEIEFHMGDQPLLFSTNTGLYIPKGTFHGPLVWKKFRKPHIEMAIMLGTGTAKEAWADSGITGPAK